MLCQLPAAVVAAIHAAVVLLVQAIGQARRLHEAVHALAELRIALLLRQVVGARAAVARLPGLAAVGGVEHAGRRDPDPDLPLVALVGNQRVQDQPGAARLPVRPRRMVAQARRHAARSGRHPRCGTGRPARRRHRGSRSPAARLQTDLDRLLALRVGEALARMAPGRAEVGRLPDRRAEPLVAAGAIDRAGRRIGDHVVQRPGLAERAAQRPRAPRSVALEDERALLGAKQDQHFRHLSLRQPAGPACAISAIDQPAITRPRLVVAAEAKVLHASSSVRAVTS